MTVATLALHPASLLEPYFYTPSVTGSPGFASLMDRIRRPKYLIPVTILVLGYTIAILVVVLSSSKMNADESPLLTTKPPELAGIPMRGSTPAPGTCPPDDAAGQHGCFDASRASSAPAHEAARPVSEASVPLRQPRQPLHGGRQPWRIVGLQAGCLSVRQAAGAPARLRWQQSVVRERPAGEQCIVRLASPQRKRGFSPSVPVAPVI
jgi:hypothetical protein